MMTREEELEMLEMTLALGNLPEDEIRKLDEVIDSVPGLRMQLHGAGLEAFSEVKALQKGKLKHFNASSSQPGIRMRLLLTAGLTRCFQNHCQHAMTPGVVMFALLGPRVISCRDCMPRFHNRLKVYDLRLNSDTECDVCLSQDRKLFTPFSVSHPCGAVISGDMCDSCQKEWNLQ